MTNIIFNTSEQRTIDNDSVQWEVSSLYATLGAILLDVIYLIVALVMSDAILIVSTSLLIVMHSLYTLIVYSKRDTIKSNVSIFPLILTIVIILVTSIFSPFCHNIIMLLLLFPPYIFARIGLKKGIYYTISAGILAASILFIPVKGNHASQIDLFSKIVLISAYFVILISLVGILRSLSKENQKLYKSVTDKDNETRMNEEKFAQLSHKIRTPLNNIMIVSDLLSKANLEERYSDMVDTIQASTNNLVSVLNSMVNITTVDALAESNVKMVFNLSNAINSTLKMFSTQTNDVGFSFKMGNTLSKTFMGDPIKLKQIFLNVIECFIKNKTGQKINIEIKVEDRNQNSLMFEFRSNKPICVPLKKGEISKSTNDKKALIEMLDLTISQKLVQTNGGELDVDLDSDFATITFTYNISSHSPRTMVQAQSAEMGKIEPSSVGNTNTKSVDLSNANVLLVEDNLINQKIVILSLKNVVHGIDVANNGKEALDKFSTSKYDIILMDIQMPIMNGYVTTQKIREIESSINTHTPIIAITANAMLGDREECIATGMDDYVSKPFQIEVLIQKMKSLLGGA